jgi:hypothetical protein
MEQPRKGAFGLSGLQQFSVKSIWLITLIDEIEESGRYPYNAVVKRLAEQRMGLPPKTDTEYAREGDVLSLLIYNAQCYRRSDKMKADGLFPFTEEVKRQAFEQKRTILCGSKKLKVREISGVLYAMQPRMRRQYTPAMGQPVKFA